jgi:hypothetical protein
VFAAMGLGLVTLAESWSSTIGGVPDTAGAASLASDLVPVSWSSPDGLLGTVAPAGWRVSGGPGPATDLGQFRIEATSPDGASFFTIAHNWLSFPELQFGPYRPGAETVEHMVLPAFLQRQSLFRGSRVTYRDRPRRQLRPTDLGISIPFDTGTIGFLLASDDGRFAAGTAIGETTYIASPRAPGLWRLRLFAAAYGPADPASQATLAHAVVTAYDRLSLEPEFFQSWAQAASQTSWQMREHGARMNRLFTHYLTAAGRSAAPDRKDTTAGWASMMHEGDYVEQVDTGEEYWVPNDRDYWWINNRGDVVGTDTDSQPSGNDWTPLRRR